MNTYDPHALAAYMRHKEYVLRVLTATPGTETEEKLRKRFEEFLLEKTGIAVGSTVSVCISSGISLVGGISPLHDHSDPSQHILATVTACSHWGDISYSPVGQNGSRSEPGSTYYGMLSLVK